MFCAPHWGRHTQRVHRHDPSKDPLSAGRQPSKQARSAWARPWLRSIGPHTCLGLGCRCDQISPPAPVAMLLIVAGVSADQRIVRQQVKGSFWIAEKDVGVGEKLVDARRVYLMSGVICDHRQHSVEAAILAQGAVSGTPTQWVVGPARIALAVQDHCHGTSPWQLSARSRAAIPLVTAQEVDRREQRRLTAGGDSVGVVTGREKATLVARLWL